MLLQKAETEALVDEAIRRCEAYAKAGADGLFVPGLTQPVLIEKLSRSIALPLNVMMTSRGPSATELLSAGATRVSLGGWPFEFMRRTYRHALKEFANDSMAFFASAQLVRKQRQ